MNLALRSVLTIFVIAGAVSCPVPSGDLFAAESFPQTPKAFTSNRFRMELGEQPVFVHKFKDAHYAHFPYPGDGPHQVTITARRAFDTLELSPKSAGIESTLDTEDLTLQFEITKPGKWVVTMDGREHLFILAEAHLANPANSISVRDARAIWS